MIVGSYFIVSLICGFITKSMNKNKGYEGGFLWGFLLSIIGVIVIALRPFNQTTQTSEVNHEETSEAEYHATREAPSTKTESSEESCSKELWMAKRIKTLLASGMLPSDARIKAEMEYSLVTQDPEELNTYNTNDLLGLADLYLSMKIWSKAKLCYEAVISNEDLNEKALIGVMLSSLKRTTLDECIDCDQPLQNNSYYESIISNCSEEISTRVKEINDCIIQRNEEIIKREKEAEEVSQIRIQEKEFVSKPNNQERKKSKAGIVVFLVVALIAAGAYYYTSIYLPKKEYQIAEENYQKAEMLISEKKYIEAYNILSGLSHKDSAEIIESIIPNVREEYYNNALKMIDEGNVRGGYDILVSLGAFKDCEERINELRPTIQKLTYENLEVGKTILFGAYRGYIKKDIEWIIVEANSDQLVLLSKKILDVRQYNSIGNDTSTNYASELEKWLNNYFVDTAFNDKQKSCLSPVYITKNSYAGFTTFLVGLPDKDDVEQYKSLGIDIKTEPSDYLNKDDYESHQWWLKGPNSSESHPLSYENGKYTYFSVWNASLVNSETGVYSTSLQSMEYGVRPIIRVDISALKEL